MSIPSHGLVADILGALDAHGYDCSDDAALGAAIILLGDVLDAYQGRINSARVLREDYPQTGEEASR